jgi:hypothetical protein
MAPSAPAAPTALDAGAPAARQALAVLGLTAAPPGAGAPAARAALAGALAPYQDASTGRIPCSCAAAEAVERGLRAAWPPGSAGGDAHRALATLLVAQALAAAEDAARAAALEAGSSGAAAGAAAAVAAPRPEATRLVPPLPPPLLLHVAGGISADALAELLPPALRSALHSGAPLQSACAAGAGGDSAPAAGARGRPVAAATLAEAGAAACPLDGLEPAVAAAELLRALGADVSSAPLLLLAAARVRDMGPAAAWACAREALLHAGGGGAAAAASAPPATPVPAAAQAFLELSRPHRADPELLLDLAAVCVSGRPPLRPYQEQVDGLAAVAWGGGWRASSGMGARHFLGQLSTAPRQGQPMPSSFPPPWRSACGACWAAPAPTGWWWRRRAAARHASRSRSRCEGARGLGGGGGGGGARRAAEPLAPHKGTWHPFLHLQESIFSVLTPCTHARPSPRALLDTPAGADGSEPRGGAPTDSSGSTPGGRAWPGARPRKVLMLVPEVVLAAQQAMAFVKQGAVAPRRRASKGLADTTFSGLLCIRRLRCPLNLRPHSGA